MATMTVRLLTRSASTPAGSEKSGSGSMSAICASAVILILAASSTTAAIARIVTTCLSAWSLNWPKAWASRRPCSLPQILRYPAASCVFVPLPSISAFLSQATTTSRPVARARLARPIIVLQPSWPFPKSLSHQALFSRTSIPSRSYEPLRTSHASEWLRTSGFGLCVLSKRRGTD